jgi:small-conductance mechanosensitive channel
LRSVIAGLLSLIVFAAIIAGVYLDLEPAIKHGNQAQLQHRLILLAVLMSLPGVIIAFLLGLSVRLVTNPKTRWLVPSIIVGLGVGITFRAVASKVQTAEKPRSRVRLAAASLKEAEPLAPPIEAIALDEPKAAPSGALEGFKNLLSAPVRWLNQSPGDVVKGSSLVEPEQKARVRLKDVVPGSQNSNDHDNHRKP